MQRGAEASAFVLTSGSLQCGAAGTELQRSSVAEDPDMPDMEHHGTQQSTRRGSAAIARSRGLGHSYLQPSENLRPAPRLQTNNVKSSV